MGLFDKVFKSQRDVAKDQIKETPWHTLTRPEQIDQILQESKETTIAVFKHSTRCGISRMVLKNFERDYDPDKHGDCKLYFLDLLANRSISDQLSERFDVQHESPQLIVLKNGKVLRHASHHSINIDSLEC